MSRTAATPIQYAAAFWAAFREATPGQEVLLLSAFAKLMSDDHMLAQWPEVEQALLSLAVERTGAVTRAVDLPAVASALGPGATVNVQPDLIAGARLRAGNRLVDSSISGQFQQLRDALAENR